MYNLEGPSGTKAICYVEKTANQGAGDFVYIVVENPKTKQLISIIDNREVIPVDARQKALVDKLKEKRIALYGGDGERPTEEQKLQFGRHFHKVIYYDCLKNRRICERAGVQGLPSWLIQGQMIPGVQGLENLEKIAEAAQPNK